MELKRQPYGKTSDGTEVDIFTLKNSSGITARVITYGCIITSVQMPDRNGKIGEITLGFDSLEGYLDRHPYFGALVGRFANRIAAGRFELEGKQYTLACNEKDRNHLHGGRVGFDKRVWMAEELRDSGTIGVGFSYTSPDGEEGYPGELKVTVTYSLSEANELTLGYRAETTKATPINLTNHTYWNLSGPGSGTIYDHLLTLECSRYLPVNEQLIPTGERLSVEGTPLDFREQKAIGQDIDQLPVGYDHCFIADKEGDRLESIARLVEPASGRGVELSTTQPAVQLYTGNYLDGIRGAGGAVFNKHTALCLETEYYPDAVNHPEFPSAVLHPGEIYNHTTVHRFFTE
jgi:aldose 1-epimerase